MRSRLATITAVLVLLAAIAVAVAPAIATGRGGSPAPIITPSSPDGAVMLAGASGSNLPDFAGGADVRAATAASLEGPSGIRIALGIAPLFGLAAIFAVGITLSMRAARRFAA